MTCCSTTDAKHPAPQATQKLPLSQRHLHAAKQSLDSGATTRSGGEAVDRFAQNLGIPQYGRTFVQGCACSTGFAGGGCCPGGASSLALQTGHSGHGVLGLLGGGFGALGIYGGLRVIGNSRDAHKHIDRVQKALTPNVMRLALLEAEAAEAKLPRGRMQGELAALDTFARALKQSAREQRFNYWVPGVLQTLAAAGAIGVAAEHVGLVAYAPCVGAFFGTAAPALFALYALVLAGKNMLELRRVPRAVEALAGDTGFAPRAHAYAQARHTTFVKTAVAWGLVGATGAGAACASASLCVLPVAPWVWLAVSLGAAGFAMWQNSQTRFVPHLPISPHVAPRDIATHKDRRETAERLDIQDAAVKDAAAQLLHDATWPVRGAHLYEQAFLPQCGPSANQVLAKVVQREIDAKDADAAAQHTRILLHVADVWCTEEMALVRSRLETARGHLGQDVDALTTQLAPSCKHKAARLHQVLEAEGTFVRTLNQTSAYLRDDAQSLEGQASRLDALADVQARIRALQQQEPELVVGLDTASDMEPSRSWLWVRLNLLLLSGTLADAVDKPLIGQHPEIFSQLATPDALPIHNVFVRPSQIEAFAQAMAPRIDGAFVHAFCNPRRIEAEIDYLFELEAQSSGQPKETTTAPVCTGETCCR